VRVFDVETESGNLIADGIVAHNSTRPLSITTLDSDNFAAGGVFLRSDSTK
jgi:hypothetical protein